MDNRLIHSVNQYFQTHLNRMAKLRLSHRLSQVFTRKIRLILGIPFLITLGVLAHDQSQSEALWEWENHQSVPQLLVESALNAHHFQELKNPGKIQTLSKALPIRIDSLQSYWLLTSPKNELWIAVFEANRSEWPLRVFCNACNHALLYKETNVLSLGSGWTGYLRLLEEFKRLKAPPVSMAPSTGYKDPRAIEF